jgi:outer membrane protein assembly factor BamB
VRVVALGSSAWLRRGLLAGMLAGATLIPGYASGSPSPPCPARRCPPQGAVRWIRPLSGAWLAEGGIVGTVPAAGQAYVSAGPQVAAVGYGMNVYAFDVQTGRRLWTAPLTGFPAGASIVSVRSWQRVVTAGVEYTDTGDGGTAREELVLSGQTGARLRGYPATAYGGAVAADRARTVIVGNTSVTSYDNATGKPLWSRPTGPVPQAWRVDGGSLLVTVAAGGYLSTAPVTALRRINLTTGAERLIRPAHGSFHGTLSAALDGVALFSGSTGLTAYSEATGELLWRRPGAQPQAEDLVRKILYVSSGTGLTGLNPRTGSVVGPASIPAASSFYGIRSGVALGLDQGSGGDAWGYDLAERRVIWTTPSLPWPHYFVDLSGIGGSADPSSGTILLSACAAVGATVSTGTTAGSGLAGGGQVCLRPELVAISR